MSFETKSLTNESTGLSIKVKNLPFGQQKCKVIKAEVSKYDTTKGVTHNLTLYLETEPVGSGFEGFFIDPENESLGRHQGRRGKVKANPFGYRDRKYKDNSYTAVGDIVDFMHRLCKENGSNWVHEVNGKYKTFEDFIDGFNKEQPIKDKFITYTIGANKKHNDESGYDDYYLNLVKPDKNEQEFANDENISKLTKFDKTLHIYDKNSGNEPVKTVTNFNTNESDDDDLETSIGEATDEDIFDIPDDLNLDELD